MFKTWLKEFRLWLSGRYPTDPKILEMLLLEIDAPMTHIFDGHVLNVERAQKRLYDTLHRRCWPKVILLGTVLTGLTVIAAFIGLAEPKSLVLQ